MGWVIKYRKLDENNDYTFIQLVNTPEAVAQAVKTRLGLWLKEWWLDEEEGTPWIERITGKSTYYDLEIKERILGTKGVLSITKYASAVVDRVLIVNCVIETIYGTATIII